MAATRVLISYSLFKETQGVCVATLGPTRDFPAFFTASSGFHSPYNVPTTQEAAQLIEHQRSMDLQSGILLATPIPMHAEADGKIIERAIQDSLKEAEIQGITGRDVTPFVLDSVNKMTEGMSMSANLALIENNAVLGAEIAVELSKIDAGKSGGCQGSGGGGRSA